jgi:hypothetical protein
MHCCTFNQILVIFIPFLSHHDITSHFLRRRSKVLFWSIRRLETKNLTDRDIIDCRTYRGCPFQISLSDSFSSALIIDEYLDDFDIHPISLEWAMIRILWEAR